MKTILLPCILLIVIGCGLSTDGYYGYGNQPFYLQQTNAFDTYDDPFSSYDTGDFYYPKSYSYDSLGRYEPRGKSEFRFDYGNHHGINWQEYEQIRETERMQSRINELERRNRFRSYRPYGLAEKQYRRYRPLDDLSPSRSKSYYHYRPFDDLN